MQSIPRDNLVNVPLTVLGGAGSITAAQFLQRFVNKVPWAHLDIAGTATGMPKTSTNTSWATGFGVHLLDTFVKKFYEK